MKLRLALFALFVLLLTAGLAVRRFTAGRSIAPVAQDTNAAETSRPNAGDLRHAIVTSTSFQQLPYATVSAQQMGLPPGLSTPVPASSPSSPRPTLLPLATLDTLTNSSLPAFARPLSDIAPFRRQAFAQHHFGRLENDRGDRRLFVPQIVLVQFQTAPRLAALRVAPLREQQAVRVLETRSDVRFAELDVLQTRQFAPDDFDLGSQWHHSVIGSFSAWDQTLGSGHIKIAIVDTPFQMDHPDLAANTEPGWSIITAAPITAGSGIAHSTLGAGMAAAVVNNEIGVAGAGNCHVLPIDIEGFTSEMYEAILWAADHDVRVVNLSWSGADSPSLNDAAHQFKRQGGVVGMAGVNGTGFLNYPDQPDLYAISMTDAADNMQSRYGNHIDFAAPGYEIFSTSDASGYLTASGTSYSTPLFCGVVAVLFSINPTLSADDAIAILKATADDRGAPGRDQYFGWGIIQFGKAAALAAESLPPILSLTRRSGESTVIAAYQPGLAYSLWRSSRLDPPFWTSVKNAALEINGNTIRLTDPAPPTPQAFYRLRFQPPSD